MVTRAADPDEPNGRDIPRIPEPGKSIDAGIPVTKRGQGCAYEEVMATVERCRQEFELTPVDIAGVLAHVSHSVIMQAWKDMDGEDDDS